MNNDFVTGARYLLRGFRLIRQPGVRRYVAIPLLLNTLIFAVLAFYAGQWLQTLNSWLTSYLPDWLDWLQWLLWPLFILVALMVIYFGFSLLLNLIGAPFNGLLAEAVETHLTGRTAPEQSWSRLLLDIAPALLNELRKIGYFLLRALPLLLLFFIPVANLASPVLWIIFSAWMLCLQYTDYVMGNHGLSFPEQRRKLAGKWRISLGFGGAALLATLIPGVNLIVMPVAVAGATAMYLERIARPT
ncbi:MAG: sulfate transporter CysZ [Gammaproteobacteria bacterium]